MKKPTIAFCAALAVVLVSQAFGMPPMGPNEKVQDVRKESVMEPVLSKDQKMEIDKLVAGFTPAALPCAPAVSVMGYKHVSEGPDRVLEYPVTITNEGGAWFKNSIFIAPCNGLYFFTIDIVRDSYYFPGTSKDDIWVYLTKNGAVVPAKAWAGAADDIRQPGSCGVILRLKAGDAIQTWVRSEGVPPVPHPKRCLGQYMLTIHRIGS
jgi:hypothetical protein